MTREIIPMEKVLADDAAEIAEVRAAVTRYATAWLAGDRAAIAACYHDEFTLHYAGRNPLAGTHRVQMLHAETGNWRRRE